MKTKEDNIIVSKSMDFALRCGKLYKFLCEKDGNYIIGKQLLRSGTSIGANVREALRGQSKADFGSKMNISLKEASETEYGWNDYVTLIISQKHKQKVCFPIVLR